MYSPTFKDIMLKIQFSFIKKLLKMLSMINNFLKTNTLLIKVKYVKMLAKFNNQSQK